jgi:hypothetical protein
MLDFRSALPWGNDEIENVCAAMAVGVRWQQLSVLVSGAFHHALRIV